MLRWVAVLFVVLNVIYFAVNYGANNFAQSPKTGNAVSAVPSLVMLREKQPLISVADGVSAEEGAAKKMRDSAARDDSSVGQEVVASANADNRSMSEVTFPLPESVSNGQEKSQTTGQSDVVASRAASGSQSCWEVGRFDSEDQGKQLAVKLAGIEHVLTVQKKAVQGEPDYWVFLGPYANRREALALHRDLRTRKIDSFLINEGQLENAVSLGLFSRRAGAEVMQQQRKKQGLDAKLLAVPRLRNEWWGVLKSPSAQLPTAVRENILAIKPELPLEIKTLGCELIANTEKLD